MWLALTVVVVAGGLGVAWATGVFTDDPYPGVDKGRFAIGPTNGCRRPAAFIAQIGPDTVNQANPGERIYVGVIVRTPDGRIYQRPGWEVTGTVGPNAVDEMGNLYVAPVPRIGLDTNPPEEQNRVYRVDSMSGNIALFADLSWAEPPSLANPFGVLGLSYDCDTQSLYATSVAGSGPAAEVGRIYRISPANAEVLDQLEGVDAVGVGVFNGVEGKRLYYGSARTPDVYSIGLDADGNFYGEPRFEFSLAAVKGGNYEMAQRISFTPDNQMIVAGSEFTFSLRAQNDVAENVYTFNYVNKTDGWDLESVAFAAR
jgi:hypothetical protein